MMESKLLRTLLELFVFIVLIQSNVDGVPAEKRIPAPDRVPEDADYMYQVKYDEYPMVVPRKRAAMLVDRLMVALQKAIEEEESQGSTMRRDDDVRTMDLQRRGHGSLSGQQKGRVYWRCYFNAVTCF